MSEKEKATELLEKFYIELKEHKGFYDIETARQCAIISVDEIINSSPSAPILSDAGSFVNDIEESTEWWKGVRVEIEKLPA